MQNLIFLNGPFSSADLVWLTLKYYFLNIVNYFKPLKMYLGQFFPKIYHATPTIYSAHVDLFVFLIWLEIAW